MNVLLAIIAAVLVIDFWLSIPQLLFLIRPGLIQNGFASHSPRILRSRRVLEHVADFEAAGFHVLGYRWERVWAGDTRTWEVALIHPEARLVAGVACNGRFATQVMRYVLTREPRWQITTNAGTPRDEADFLRRVVPDGNAAALVEPHPRGSHSVDTSQRLLWTQAFYACPTIQAERRARGRRTWIILMVGILILLAAALVPHAGF